MEKRSRLEENNFKFLSELVANENELDIRSYTLKIKDHLTKLETQCLSDYLRSADDIATLYQELEKSDEILTKIDNVVDSFQGQLITISEEVGKLQQ